MSWIALNEAASLRYCCAKGSSSAISLPSGGTMTTMPLDTWVTCSDSGLYTFSNGGIQINEAGMYFIGANIYFVSPANAQRGIYLYNGDGKELHAVLYGADGGTPHGPACLAPKTMGLSAGTVIYLKGRSIGGSGDGKGYPNNRGTYLTIIKLA